MKKYACRLVTGLLGLVWLVINIRVEAGAATSLERAVDGLVGGALLLALVFGAVSFFSKKGKERER